jgi:hypothetical protein
MCPVLIHDDMVQVQRDPEHQPPAPVLQDDLPQAVEDMIRHVRYSVPKKMLECQVIETRYVRIIAGGTFST